MEEKGWINKLGTNNLEQQTRMKQLGTNNVGFGSKVVAHVIPPSMQQTMTLKMVKHLSVLVLLCLLSHGTGVGIKRRLEAAQSIEASGAEEVGERASASSSSGGIRQRLQQTDHAPSTSSSPDTPYTDYLKQQWGQGKP